MSPLGAAGGQDVPQHEHAVPHQSLFSTAPHLVPRWPCLHPRPGGPGLRCPPELLLGPSLPAWHGKLFQGVGRWGALDRAESTPSGSGHQCESCPDSNLDSVAPGPVTRAVTRTALGSCRHAFIQLFIRHWFEICVLFLIHSLISTVIYACVYCSFIYSFNYSLDC